MSDDPALDPALIAETASMIPRDEALASMSALAQRERAEAIAIMDLTEKLQEAQVRYRQITEVDLPQALAWVGMVDFSLADGTKVALQTRFEAGQLTNPTGLAWAAANGGASLIKTTIELELDRGDIAVAKEIFNLLKQHRHANQFKKLELTERILPQTVGKFARELIEGGKDPPLQTLGVHRRSYAIVGARPKSVEIKGFKRPS